MARHDPDLTLIFQALSDPTRRSMLVRLGKGAVPVSDLAAPTGLRLPTVMRHIAVLEDAGLIETEKRGRTRMCHARPAALQRANEWLAERRAEWEARTDRLEAFLETLEALDESEPRDGS